ncbi:MAG: hypothetical protein QOH71_3811 [Blastocatellia bacterium]|jgi:hypothetical protein|nr:hypothetical protein [Blastocatellia bacterium]
MILETDFALLLTASVNPNGMPGVSQPDPADREQTYIDCLSHYLRNDPRVRKIVFAENSGWPLDRIQQSAAINNESSKEIEFISLNCTDFPREKGKSYGELLLMDKALERSNLIRSSRYVGKMTGRNLLLNMTKILDSAPGDFEFLCDIRDHNLYEFFRLDGCGHHCDSRFFVFAADFHERYLRGSHARFPFESGYMIEGLLYDLVKRTEKTERVIKRFNVEPEFRGLAGHFIRNKSKDYGAAREILKRRIRSCSRRVAPWLHI